MRVASIRGIAADLLRLVAERAGLRLRILPTADCGLAGWALPVAQFSQPDSGA